ncbi:MAG TPA: mucoidy inhibitor MuiA family protein [Anaeromyxobacter sp.]|nr:mucoidy inhibitor MuiA family protein [Anaeromyxobacter sp.]
MRTLVLAAALVPALSAAADLSASSRIDAVTVYQSSARVTRAARAEVQPGPARVLLAGLPEQLDDDSIRVEGKGSARARIFGVTVERVTGEATAQADARAAEEKLERLQDEDRGLDDRARAAQARLKFVESLRSTYSEERAKNLAVRGVSAKEWNDLAEFVAAETAAAGQELRKAEVARRDLARRIAQARAELDKVQAKRGRTTKTVAVEVEADRAGALELAVSYVVHAAGWQPIWDARLAPETSTMELSFLGSVWQRTGEDWQGVTLSVSTAQPARGLFVPDLQPLWLQRYDPPRPTPRRAPSAPAAAAPMAPMARSEAKLGYAADEPEQAESVEAEVAQASVHQGLLSATFTAPRRETVDGSGQARKVPLARFPLQATIVRTAAPRVDASAFLTAKAVNETGFPLLAGVAGVYVGDEFAGRAALPATPAGGELELAFGADGRVEIERRVLDRRHESAGLISKDDVYSYRVRTSVKNRWAAPVAVKLLDLVPVSRDEKISVKILDGTTAATREDPERPGVRIHELTLAAREERVVELRYEVRYPRGFPIAGLE